MSAVRAALPPRRLAALALALLLLVLVAALAASPAAAAAVPDAPAGPAGPAGPQEPDGPTVSVDVQGLDGGPGSAISIILAITALSVAPALLLLCTSFTKILVVLGLTRNALGLPTLPPNQVLAGLALFLSLFVMAPVISEVNEVGVQPYLAGRVQLAEAFEDGTGPLREFMLGQTRPEDLALITGAADREAPEQRADVPLTSLVPAFVLSELRSAFLIGFVVFVPFLVIDLVVAAALMSMGMMMLPPVTVSLPFKLLLFVLVDGWGLVAGALVGSYG